jgi:hypothetical protein
MSIFESALSIGESVFNAAVPFADKVKAVPGLGEGISAMQSMYNFGAAGYNAITGDRDGAINRAVQGGVLALGAVPGAKDLIGGIDKVLGPAGGVVKGAGMGLDNKTMQDAPQSTAEVAASEAVFLANAWFGKDDTNWIADGDTPQGTKRGEIGAGLSMITPLGGPILGPVWAAINGAAGNPIGNFAGDLLGVKPDEKTSGATPGLAAQAGQGVHDFVGSLFHEAPLFEGEY